MLPILSIIILPYQLYAASYFYCVQTGQYAYIGDTLNQVQAKCGSAASTQTQQTPSKKEVPVDMWVYNAKQDTNTNNISGYSNQVSSGEAVLIINLINNKVASIIQYGQAVDSTQSCGLGGTVNVGDPQSKIRYYCGAPSSVQQVTQTISTPSETHTILTYNQGYASPVTLTFDGKDQLISIDS